MKRDRQRPKVDTIRDLIALRRQMAHSHEAQRIIQGAIDEIGNLRLQLDELNSSLHAISTRIAQRQQHEHP